MSEGEPPLEPTQPSRSSNRQFLADISKCLKSANIRETALHYVCRSTTDCISRCVCRLPVSLHAMEPTVEKPFTFVIASAAATAPASPHTLGADARRARVAPQIVGALSFLAVVPLTAVVRQVSMFLRYVLLFCNTDVCRNVVPPQEELAALDHSLEIKDSRLVAVLRHPQSSKGLFSLRSFARGDLVAGTS